MKKQSFSTFIWLIFVLYFLCLTPKYLFCSEWVWQSPSPTVEDLNDLWGTSSSFIFAVGNKGTIIHFDGNLWSLQSSGTTNALHGIWGNVWSNVFSVGDNGTILHFNGLLWSTIKSDSTISLQSVWGTSETDVFTVGSGGTILHFDGTEWKSMDSGTSTDLNDVWGTSSNNVFAVGDDGTILHFNGTHWDILDSGSSADLNAICGSSSGNVFAVGSSGTIHAYNGIQWEIERSGTATYHDIYGFSESQFYVVGEYGKIVLFNGSSWNQIPNETGVTLYSVWGTSPSNVYISGSGGNVFRKNESAWDSMTHFTQNRIYSIWGFESFRYGREIYIMGEEGVVLNKKDCEGAAICDPTDKWESDRYSVKGLKTIYDTWGHTVYSSNYLYGVGEQGSMFHFNPRNDRWTEIESGVTENLYDIWGISFSDTTTDIMFLSVGDTGTIIRYDGTEASEMNSGTTKNLRGIWGSAADDFFAVGNTGTILHYDGNVWTSMESPTTENLRGIWGNSANNIFAVGRGGTILHYDGNTWTSMDGITHVDLNCVGGIGGDNVYASGNNGAIFHYDGNDWEQVDNGTDFGWEDVWGGASGDFFFVGGKGKILSFLQKTDIPNGPVDTDYPTNPYPEDGASGIPLSVTLQWTFESLVADVITYDIYFGVEEDPPRVAENIADTSYDPGPLNPDTVYFWKVVAKDTEGNIAEGPVWSFMTFGDEFSDYTFYDVIGFESSMYGRELVVMGDGTITLYKKDCEGAPSCEPTDSWVVRSPDISLKTIFGSWGYTIYKDNFLYAVGAQGRVYSYQPRRDRWSEIEISFTEDLHDIWGVSYSNTEQNLEFITVGNAGTILNYNGSEWIDMESGTANGLYGVWGSSAEDVFAVGNTGTILHYDGNAWKPMDSGTTENLLAIWGFDVQNVYTVGASGTILNYNGTSWSAMDSRVEVDLNCIWGISTDNIFAAGSNGAVLKYDGYEWMYIDSGVDSVWYDVWGGASGDFFFVGDNGTVLSFLPPFNPYPQDGATDIPLTALLNWSIEHSEMETITYDVYFGTEDEPPLAAEDLNITSYNPGFLDKDTVYYWKVVARNKDGEETQGPLWSFTTASSICVASFLMNDEADLQSLRQYRDTVLNRTKLGRKLIGWYYKYGADLIKVLDSSPVLKEFAKRYFRTFIMPLFSS